MNKDSYTTLRRLALALIFCGTALFSYAAYLRNVPTTLVQPDGDTLRCLATGDEFYHRLHDSLDYTIVMNPETGFYVYAHHVDKGGELVGSSLVARNRAGLVAELRGMGVPPRLTPSPEALRARRKAWEVPEAFRKPAPTAKTGNTNRGTINNIVVFIRFADEGNGAFSSSLASLNGMFNDSSSASTSMYQYFREVSYGQLTLQSHFFPAPNGSQIVSYQDSLPRSYFQPYNATTNPNGYTDRYDGRERAMLERCIRWINQNQLVPASLDIDYDNDGYIDNIIFVVSGTYTGWSDILWPHQWSLYDRYCYINGKRAYTFNLQLEGSGSHYFSSSTLCHEMFHALGAPDLYHYEENTSVSPAGSWDLMCSNTTPPQHTSAFMKMTYGNWMDSIPEITAPGTYTLASLADQNAAHPRAYRIASDDPSQYYVLEYRDDAEHFETGLPGGGLLVWRVDTRYNGNANSEHDGYYLFRPGAADETTNGSVSQAHLGAHAGRPAFTPQSNPHPWLNTNTADPFLSLTNIARSADRSTLSFTYSDLRLQLHTSEQELAFGSNGGSQTVGVVPTQGSAAPWSAVSAEGWLSVSPASGSGAATLTVTAAANPTGDYRVGTVQLAQGGDTYTLRVVQSACMPGEMCTLRVLMHDSYGDGWNGSSLALESPSGHLYGTATLADGAEGVASIGVCNSNVVLRWSSASTWDSEVTFDVANLFDTLYRRTTRPAAGVLASIASPCPDCTLELPYSTGFEEEECPELCWTVVHHGVTSNEPTHSTAQAYSGSRSFRFSSYYRSEDYNQYLVSPPMPTDAPKQLSFYYRRHTSGTEQLTVGYSASSPDVEAGSWVWGGTMQVTNTAWQAFSLELPAEARYVALHYYGDYQYYLYIDDLALLPAEPLHDTFTVSASPCDLAHGSVSGGGAYEEGSPVCLSATATECYQFVSWSNGSTDNPLCFLCTRDTSLTAQFDPIDFSGSDTLEACDSLLWNGALYSASGTYLWLGRTAAGCDSTATLLLTLHHSATNTTYASAPDSYAWHDSTYTESGTYLWVGQTAHGCDSVVTLYLTIFPSNPEGIGETPDSGIQISVHPNPCRDRIEIQNPEFSIQNVQIIDLQGRVVLHSPLATDHSPLDLRSLPSGTYLLRVSTAEGTAVQRIIKL